MKRVVPLSCIIALCRIALAGELSPGESDSLRRMTNQIAHLYRFFSRIAV